MEQNTEEVNKKFVLRLDWEKFKVEELKEYIDELHKYILEFQTSSIHDILLELDNVARVIAKDLGLIANGEGHNAKFLTESKDDKQYERVMAMVDKASKWQEISNMAKSLRPDFVPAEGNALKEGEYLKSKVKITKGKNAFEQVMIQIKEGK